MEDNILFYDKNSIDCTLAVLINNVLFKYICYPVDSNETDLNEYIPPIELTAKNYWFIGLKPTNQWITNNQSSAVINIIYKNVDITDYINSQINVNIPITLHKSLAYNFFISNVQHDFPISAFENYNFQINKIKELLDNFESYTENYQQPILNPKWLSAYFTICSFSRMFNLNNVSNLIRLMENSEKLVNELTGLLNAQYYKSEINDLISKSKIVNRTNLDKCLLININRKEDIYQIDKYLTEYVLNNNLIIDYIEYCIIDENFDITVYIKKFNMFVSPIEISQDLLLMQHIGLQNKSNIYLYLFNNFEIDVLTDVWLKVKTNGLIKYKTTMKKFFNII